MALTIAVNATNDIHRAPDGNLAMASDLQAVLQNCAHAAKAQRGEMVLHIEDGVPNFELIWSGSPRLAQFEAALRDALENVDGVIEVRELSTTVNGNTLSYTATIRTIYGTGAING